MYLHEIWLVRDWASQPVLPLNINKVLTMVVHISTTILVWQHLLESTVVGRSISDPFSAVHDVSLCTAAGTGQKSFPLSFENTVSCSYVVLRHDSSYVTTSYAGIDCVIDVIVLHMALFCHSSLLLSRMICT